jgi:hypothetical protein
VKKRTLYAVVFATVILVASLGYAFFLTNPLTARTVTIANQTFSTSATSAAPNDVLANQSVSVVLLAAQFLAMKYFLPSSCLSIYLQNDNMSLPFSMLNGTSFHVSSGMVTICPSGTNLFEVKFNGNAISSQFQVKYFDVVVKG